YQKSPLIKEICVLGLASAPGEPFSERLHAVIVPNFETLKQRKIVNAKEVIRFDVENLSQQLAPAKRILGYEIWQEDLPRTTTRKLKRFEIEKRVGASRNQDRSKDTPSLAPTPLTSDEQLWLQERDVQRALQVIRSVTQRDTDPGPSDKLEIYR